MAGGYLTPAGNEYDVIVAELRKLAERLSELEMPTGTSINSLVQQVQQAIAEIGTTVEAWLEENSYTAPQIDAKVASPGPIAPTTVTASGSGSFGGDLSTGGQFYCLDAYNFDITYTRRTAWWGNDGRAGFASSSVLKKCAIRPAEIDPVAVLAAEPKSFYYRREIERRTQMRIDGLGDYIPKREVGLLAQDLDALGLGWLVYYDEDGNAEGIEYSMLTVALLAVARHQNVQIGALQSDVAQLRAAVAARQEGAAS